MSEEEIYLSPELYEAVKRFLKRHPEFGYRNPEEFIREAVREETHHYSEDIEWIGISKRDYEKLEEAVKAMDTPYRNAADFIHGQIKKAIEDHEKWK